jgi:hypothetical protein
MGDGRREKLYSIANSLTKRHTVLVVMVLALCRGGGADHRSSKVAGCISVALCFELLEPTTQSRQGTDAGAEMCPLYSTHSGC